MTSIANTAGITRLHIGVMAPDGAYSGVDFTAADKSAPLVAVISGAETDGTDAQPEPPPTKGANEMKQPTQLEQAARQVLNILRDFNAAKCDAIGMDFGEMYRAYHKLEAALAASDQPAESYSCARCGRPITQDSKGNNRCQHCTPEQDPLMAGYLRGLENRIK